MGFTWVLANPSGGSAWLGAPLVVSRPCLPGRPFADPLLNVTPTWWVTGNPTTKAAGMAGNHQV